MAPSSQPTASSQALSLPVDLVARDRSVVALRDFSVTPMAAIDLETADAATRAPFCATLGRWVGYFGMPLDELTYWYVSDPQSLAVSTIQVRGKSTGFKIFSGPKLKAACPGLKSGER